MGWKNSQGPPGLDLEGKAKVKKSWSWCSGLGTGGMDVGAIPPLGSNDYGMCVT